MSKINPLGDRVLVEPEPAESKTASGIIIPDTAKERPNKGTIVAIGQEESLVVKKGDEVIYGKHAGTEIVVDGQTFLIMRESDIFAVIN